MKVRRKLPSIFQTTTKVLSVLMSDWKDRDYFEMEDRTQLRTIALHYPRGHCVPRHERCHKIYGLYIRRRTLICFRPLDCSPIFSSMCSSKLWFTLKVWIPSLREWFPLPPFRPIEESALHLSALAAGHLGQLENHMHAFDAIIQDEGASLNLFIEWRNAHLALLTETREYAPDPSPKRSSRQQFWKHLCFCNRRKSKSLT